MARDAPKDATNAILMDGAPTIQADMLQIDFLKADFDRRRSSITKTTPEDFLNTGDPPVSLAFRALNSFLATIRTVTQGFVIKLLMPGDAFWLLEYLADDETPLKSDDEVIHLRCGTRVKWRPVGVNTAVWKSVGSLNENFAPSTWETLLLDAEGALPQIGASIVLAFAALETLIESSLDHLAARSSVPALLWKWINERQKDDRLTPSVSEQFDVLLQCLTGRSLKEEEKLWEAFQNLKSARNSFVHGGRAVIGKQEVTAERAGSLVVEAKNIANWIESLLPAEFQRKQLKGEFKWQFTKMLAAPAPE